MTEQSKKLLTIRRLMDWLDISRPKVFELMRNEGLPRIKMGSRTLRFEKEAVEQWLEERKEPA